MHIQDPQSTLESVERARILWEELVRREPSVPGFRNELGIFLHVIAALQLGASQTEESLRTYRRAVEVRGGLVREFPSVPHYRGALAMTLRDESQALVEAGRLRDAEEVCREAREHLRKLVTESPGVPAWEDLLTDAIDDRLGHILEDAGRLSEAEGCYREMLAVQERLLAGHPTVARYRYGVLCARTQLGELLWGSGRRAEAEDQYRRIRLLGASLGPDERQSRDELAWFLATSPDRSLRDGAEAARIARRLAEEEPRNPQHQLTLGLACDSAGDWRGAIEALERQHPVFLNRDVLSNLLLARAHWRLGQTDEARMCYQRALSRWERQRNQSLRLRRIRAETETILGNQGN
jgi:tetratricopeptide (TPR) repeat protein